MPPSSPLVIIKERIGNSRQFIEDQNKNKKREEREKERENKHSFAFFDRVVLVHCSGNYYQIARIDPF